MSRIIAISILLAMSCAFCSLAAGSPVITLSGSVDASNVMTINSSSVSWTNNTGDVPTALTVNGTPWNPSAQSMLSLMGPLLPVPLSDYIVSTTVSSGRDVANAQIVGSQVKLFIDDTPSGADNYSVQVSFTPRPALSPSPSATIHVTGDIDGSDVLTISNSAATWTHNAWDSPSNVTLNGSAWNTVSQPTRPNSGATTFLPAGVDLSSVVFSGTGRDTLTYQLFGDHINVYFGDDQFGAGHYDATLTFGTLPEPSGIGIVALGVLALRRRNRKARSED